MLYRQHFDWLGENLSSESAEHVLTILEIYSDMHNSYRDLPDKSGIEERRLHFPGFDGNNESELLGFAQALRKHDRFVSTIGPSAKNAHMPTTEMYGRMTLPGYRSKGHGAKLLSWLKEQAAKEGCEQVHLDSGIQRKEAHRFYERESMNMASFHFFEKIAPNKALQPTPESGAAEL